MIASLHGRLAAKDAEGAVIDCGGVGYGVSMSLSSLAALGPVGSEVHVAVHTHVTQDTLRLYGFIDAAERRAFRVLIGISRVGPKLALAVLSALSPTELADAVARGDAVALGRIPGVGKKTAERLLLELRDKLGEGAGGAAGGVAAGGRASLAEDLVSALVNLGFKEAVADRAAQAALTALPGETDVATLVREALRSTTRR